MLTDADVKEMERLEKAATAADEMTMLQDRWIEWRGKDGSKYSIAEFEREADQEFFYFARTFIPKLLADRRAMAERIAGMERVVEAARNMIEDAKNNVHRMTPLGPLIQSLSALKTGGSDE